MTNDGSTTRRRIILGAAGGLIAASAQAAPASLKMADIKKEGDVACLYHCDYGDQPRFAQTLNNISNHYSVYGSDPFGLQLALVVHSVGIKFFLSTLDGTPWKDEVIPPDTFERLTADRDSMAVYTAEEVLATAAKGNVVVRGWGATCLLRPVPHVVCVRITWPLAMRVEWLTKELETDDADF